VARFLMGRCDIYSNPGKNKAYLFGIQTALDRVFGAY